MILVNFHSLAARTNDQELLRLASSTGTTVETPLQRLKALS